MLDAKSVSEGIRNRLFSAEEYIYQILDRIERIDPRINAFITVNGEGALLKARSIDKKIRDGHKVGPLAGVAVGIKDNISTRNIKTTCASKMLQDYVPPYSATVVNRLERDGGIVIGKLNLDEFAMGSTTEFSRFGPTRNPWNISYSAGGSSGGSAASVSAAECTVSLGSDTGGSIRCPASFCSVVGLKPTYGLVSRYGLVSYANSLEQIGPVGKNISDVCMILNSIAGADDKDDTTSCDREMPYKLSSKDSTSNKKLRVGLLKELVHGADKEISKCTYSALNVFENLGFKCEETTIELDKYLVASYYTIAMAEASSNLARFDNIRYGYEQSPDGYEWNNYISKVRANFGDEVKRRIIIGSFVLSSGYYGKYYLKAQKVRSLLTTQIKNLFKKFDLLLTPTMPIMPSKLGEKIEDPVKMYLADIDTVLANLTGIPAISIPGGFHDGLPIGLQLMADHFNEQLLLDAGWMFEQTARIGGTPSL